MPIHPDEPAAPLITIVVPMRNEASNVAYMVEEIGLACAPLGPFEAIFVDDGSTDGTAEAVRALAARHPWVRLVLHETCAGQSAAIDSGVHAARAPLVCTLDGDGQNPPAEIAKLVALLDAGRLPAGVGLIAGQRVGRRDTTSKRWASRAANGIRARLLRDGTRDTGCGLKLFSREGFLALPYFDHMHRYLPALFARDGQRTLHVDVAHAERRAGRSNYGNLSRALVGIHDLMGVMWLIRRRKKARAIERTAP